MNNLIIRNEQEKDHRAVEEATREAFWNLYVPGCDEHYLVHTIRKSPDFVAELAFVAELDGELVGSIFFTKSYIIDERGERFETLTFGPLSVLPRLQGQGIGAALIAHAKKAAIERGDKAILIYGYPGYYKRHGFRSAKEFGISNPEGKFPAAHMVLELYSGALSGVSGKAFESADFRPGEPAAVEKYDATFAPKEKKATPSQKDFEKMASSFL